jgi:hypothetical protein
MSESYNPNYKKVVPLKPDQKLQGLRNRLEISQVPAATPSEQADPILAETNPQISDFNIETKQNLLNEKFPTLGLFNKTPPYKDTFLGQFYKYTNEKLLSLGLDPNEKKVLFKLFSEVVNYIYYGFRLTGKDLTSFNFVDELLNFNQNIDLYIAQNPRSDLGSKKIVILTTYVAPFLIDFVNSIEN